MSNSKTAKRRRRWKQLLGAGCLALGMATAWGGEAQAGATTTQYLNVTSDTAQTISDVFIYYGIGNSQYVLQSLGNLPAGPSTLSFVATGHPESANYALVGLYGQGQGMAIAFSDERAVGVSWDVYFNSDYQHYLESDVIQYVQNAVLGQTDELEDFLYYGLMWRPFHPSFGSEATVTCFSDGTDGGSTTVVLADEPFPEPTAVPEPATWVLLVGLAGVALVGRRKLLGN